MKICDYCRRGLNGETVHRRDSALTEIDPYPETLDLCAGCASAHDRHLTDQKAEADLRREELGEPATYEAGR